MALILVCSSPRPMSALGHSRRFWRCPGYVRLGLISEMLASGFAIEALAFAHAVDCPSGKSASVWVRDPALGRPTRPEIPCALERISRANSTRFGSSRSNAENNPLFIPPRLLSSSRHPASCRGAYASSRYVECGLRWTRRRCARERLQGGESCERLTPRRTSGVVAYGKTVWSWRPLLASSFAEAEAAQPGSGFRRQFAKRRRQNEFVSGESTA